MAEPVPQPVNDPQVLAELRAAFERYERALTANDVPVLIEMFRDSPETVRYGVGENLYGAEAIARFRRERPTGPFRRRLMNTVITSYGRDMGVTSTEYMREGHDRPGRETKVFLRTDAGWKVVAAHVSLLGETV